MELLRRKCPVCHSSDIEYHSPYTTKNHGGRVIYKCDTCPVYFSETKKTLMEGLKTPVSVIWHVIQARTEGMGLNRTVRSFSKANPKFDFWRAKKGRFWPKLRPKRTIYTAVITAHEPPSVVTIGLPTKNNFSNFRRFNNLY